MLSGKAAQLLTVGGSPSCRDMGDPYALSPTGMTVSTVEDATQVTSIDEHRFGYLVKQAEEKVMEIHARGHTSATHLRYLVIYEPGQVRSAIRRLGNRAT